MSGRFANREVCDLIISDYATQEPLLYCDYANTNSAELTSESVHAFGGWGHPKRIGFNGEKGGSLTVETQIQSFQLWKMLTGGVATGCENMINPEESTETEYYSTSEFKKGHYYAATFHIVKPVSELPGGRVTATFSIGNACTTMLFEPEDNVNGDFGLVLCPEEDYAVLSGLDFQGNEGTFAVSNVKISETTLVVQREMFMPTENNPEFIPKYTTRADSMEFYRDNEDGIQLSPAISTDTDGRVTSAYMPHTAWGHMVIIYYMAEMPVGVRRLNIKSTTFPKAVSISAFTYNKSENDEILPYQMRVYKAQPQASLTLQNSNTGDPVTLTMTFDLLADKANNMLDMILMEDLAIIEQPVDAVGAVGDTVYVGVKATGTGLIYDWQKKAKVASEWIHQLYNNQANRIGVQVTSNSNNFEWRCVITDVFGNSVITNVFHIIKET